VSRTGRDRYSTGTLPHLQACRGNALPCRLDCSTVAAYLILAPGGAAHKQSFSHFPPCSYLTSHRKTNHGDLRGLCVQRFSWRRRTRSSSTRATSRSAVLRDSRPCTRPSARATTSCRNTARRTPALRGRPTRQWTSQQTGMPASSRGRQARLWTRRRTGMPARHDAEVAGAAAC